MTQEMTTLKGWSAEKSRIRRGRLAYARELVEVWMGMTILTLGVIGAAVAKRF